MKGIGRTIAGLLLGGAAIAFILTRVDLVLVREKLASANIGLLVLSALVATCIFPLRALRWRVILHPVDPDISLGALWRATCIGFGLNNLLPARLGEAARAVAIAKESKRIGFGAAVASLAVDRIFDAIVLLLLMGVGALGMTATIDAENAGNLRTAITLFVVVAIGLVGCAYVLAFFPAAIIGIWRAVTRPVSAGLERFGSAVFASAAQSLAALRQPQRFALVFGWALAHWLVNSLAFWIGFSAVGIEVSFLAAMFTQGVVAMASSLPQAPAFAGGFQVAGLLALSAFGVPQESATAWGIGYWLFSFVPITALGLYYTLRTQLTMRELKEMVTRAGDEHATRTTPT